MRTIKISTGVLLVGLALPFLMQAQPTVETASQQQQSAQQNMEQQQMMNTLHAGTNAPEIYQGESSDVGPQHILRVVPRRTYFQARVDSQYLYSDNVFLTRSFQVPGTIFVNTISLAFAPPAYRVGEGRLSPTIGALTQWYNYGLGGHDLSAFNPDFNVQTVFASVKYLLPGDWTIFGDFNYSRYVSQNNSYAKIYDGEEFYHDWTPTLGVQRLARIRDDMILVVSLRGDYHKTWTGNGNGFGQFDDLQDRADVTATASLNYQIVPKLVLQPYYQYQFTHYRWDTFHFQARNDQLNSMGIAVAYYFSPKISFRGFVNYNDKRSDDSATLNEYHEFNCGANLTGTIRF